MGMNAQGLTMGIQETAALQKSVMREKDTVCCQINQILCAQNWQSFLCCWIPCIVAHSHMATLIIRWNLSQLLQSAL